MKADLVYIVPYSISFGDLKRGKVTPILVYQTQTIAWIFDPVNVLEKQKTSAPANGMAAFAILLMFFEAHGQYILGIDSKNNSRHCFTAGFERFRDSLPDESRGIAPKPDNMYRWARCGLFHSAKLANDLLVDTVNCGSGIFTQNESVSATLVNPWRMRCHLESYLNAYCKEVAAEPKSELAVNFAKTFGRLITEPMEHFCGS